MNIKKWLYLYLFTLFLLLNSCASTGRVGDTGHPRESLKKDRGTTVSRQTYYGKASYYAEKFHGKKTSNGEIFDMNAFTAAHRTLPFGTMCKVTNLANNKTVMVRINDRGPFVGDRIIDLSKAAAQAIDGIIAGIMDVKIEIIEIPE